MLLWLEAAILHCRPSEADRQAQLVAKFGESCLPAGPVLLF